LCIGIDDSGSCRYEDSLLLDQTQSHFVPHMCFMRQRAACPARGRQNERPAVRNNVLGKLGMARAATRNQVDHFVQISTDKAVNPSM
jgi:FlaA1/EpsC-like NDP-sugar epimerase